MSLAAAGFKLRGLYRDWGPLLKATAVIAAAVWTLIEYESRSHEADVQAVLEYRRQLRSEPLFLPWRQVTIVNTEDTPEEDRAIDLGGRARERFFYERAAGVRDDLDTLISFYDELWSCVQSTICDHGEAVALFGSESDVLYQNYAVYIDCQRRMQNQPDYAIGLISIFHDRFVLSMKREPRPMILTGDDCKSISTPHPDSAAMPSN